MFNLDRRRSSIEIMADILRLGEASKTEIMYTVNMSYTQFHEYLNILLKLKLIDETPATNQLMTYRVTQKGFTLLKKIDSVLEMLEGKQPIDLRH